MPAPAESLLLLRPRDPLIVRDARPFSAEPGARAVSLPWPLPGTVAGALRGHLGNSLNWDWNDPTRQADARKIALTGLFRVARQERGQSWTVYLPAPRDAVPFTDDNDVKQLMCLRPLADFPDGAGCGQPNAAGVMPVAVTTEKKPDSGIAAWSYDEMIQWLAAPFSADRPTAFLNKLPSETRTHVKIDYATGAADAGFLFSTEGLAFAPATRGDQPETAILCRTDPGALTVTWESGFLPLGGERRQTHLDLIPPEEHPRPDPFHPAQEISAAVSRLPDAAKCWLRLVLATPAFFAKGWLPGDLSANGRIGRLLGGATLTPRGAVIDRRIAVSGWDMAVKGPKPTRYAVPAGSVYFFELDRDLTPADIAALWLKPVSDLGQDRTDGYGLVLPGVWSQQEAS